VRTGNFAYFDTAHQRLGPLHTMASGALPPGFPPVEIEGESYWDGGLVSNTPLQYVLDEQPHPDLCVFQVDLFGARGPMPQNLLDAAEREKDIRYSSRTRLNTDAFRQIQTMRRAVSRLLDKLPAELDDDPDVARLRELRCDAAVTIVHLIHRRAAYQNHSKDYEFSRRSVEDHWQAGRDDVRQTLRHPAWQTRRRPKLGVEVLDLTDAAGAA
jgi:NTE family protein